MDGLVKGFAEGQVSRRVFIRRMVEAGATLSGATLFANLIQATPALAFAPPAQVWDYSFYPSKLRLGFPDDYVYWQWDVSASGHSVTETSGLNLFDSSKHYSPTPPIWNWVTAFGWQFWAAGTSARWSWSHAMRTRSSRSTARYASTSCAICAARSAGKR